VNEFSLDEPRLCFFKPRSRLGLEPAIGRRLRASNELVCALDPLPAADRTRFAQYAHDTNMSSEDPTRSNRVLIVDDAPEIVQIVEHAIGDGPYELMTARTGPAALETARSFDPDIVILDVGLPGMDGIEVCRELRSFTDAYIIMLTGRSEEVDRLIGLSVGADDYMTKPFSVRELALRVQVLLRRPRGGVRSEASPPAAPTDEIVVGQLRIDLLAREVSTGGVTIVLTKTEFDLLVTLAQRPDMVFTRQLLVQSVWGDDWYGDDHMVSVHMANLRKKIDADAELSHIRTVRGVGYRLNPDVR